MYQQIILEIYNVIRNKNNMIESLKHYVKEKALMKMHCNNMKTQTSVIVFLSK